MNNQNSRETTLDFSQNDKDFNFWCELNFILARGIINKRGIRDINLSQTKCALTNFIEIQGVVSVF